MTHSMFDVAKYLRRIGVEGTPPPTLDTLRHLHKRHLMAVPYDNSTAPTGSRPRAT
ncbi:hypothetical protein SVIO_020820 [Streptomyces violaceusniger]|uniref:Uncharacterized protein n=1 Tax=Streptomyces violaceusniger TaxID=68280 RepID=A0A4D4L087_STRVO|nr:hypothetical protein SVIO_020820 [Streptomyces violaceusniger]